MLLAGFEPAISASEWLQTLALDRAATRIGFLNFMPLAINTFFLINGIDMRHTHH
jgi:hypothetical protein